VAIALLARFSAYFPRYLHFRFGSSRVLTQTLHKRSFLGGLGQLSASSGERLWRLSSVTLRQSRLRQNIGHNTPIHIREAVVAPAVEVGEFGVVNAHQVQNGEEILQEIGYNVTSINLVAIAAIMW
jgi:hypothetical protein